MKINVPANTKTVTLNIVRNEMLELKKKIEQGMAELKLSQSGLSKAIGHSRNYLSECLRVGVSTEKQKEIANKIDWLLCRKSIDSMLIEDDEISAFVGRAYHDQEVAKLKNANAELFNASSIKDFQINQLEKDNIELKEIRDNLVNECAAHEQELVALHSSHDQAGHKISDLQKANIDLMNELKAMEKNMSVWRFLAWVTLAVLLVSVYAWVMG